MELNRSTTTAALGAFYLPLARRLHNRLRAFFAVLKPLPARVFYKGASMSEVAITSAATAHAGWWIGTITEDQWRIYKRVIDEVTRRNIPFALGGAVAFGTYTGRWRNTKDMDLYI